MRETLLIATTGCLSVLAAFWTLSAVGPTAAPGSAPASIVHPHQRAPSAPGAIVVMPADPATVRSVGGSSLSVVPSPNEPLQPVPTVFTPPPPPPPVAAPYRLVIVRDADTIDARTVVFRLAGITAPPAQDRCTNAAGQSWPCGMRARTALSRLIRRRALDCLTADGKVPPAKSTDPVSARCSVAGTDLAHWMVEQGWASPAANAPDDLKHLHAIAVADHRGLFDPAAR